MTDLTCWIMSGVGTLLCVYLLYLNDWDVESLLYEEEDIDTH